mgnify:CR=1 FL=1|jgi:hypothetical protein
MDQIYNYVFWHNSYEQIWYAIPRDQYTEFFSGNRNYKNVIKSSKIDTLIMIIENPNLEIQEDGEIIQNS